VSRNDGSAYPLTPDVEVAAIRREDAQFWDDHDYARDFPTRPTDAELMPERVYHARAVNGRLPCCGRSPWDISPWDRLTKYTALVTCSNYGERYVKGLRHEL